MLVRLLGGVEIASDTQEWRTVPGKRGGVLAVLAMAERQPVPAEEVVYRVWGDAAVELGTSTVYPHITRLRAMLPSDEAAIIRSSRGYVLDIDPERVDLLAMRRLGAAARAEVEGGRIPRAVRTWRQATTLARGEALAGVDGDWAEQVRRQFGAELTSILTESFDCELRIGRHAAVVDELFAAVARYRDCEPLARLLVLALYRCGRQAEALEVFARTESRLREQLGIDPSASFRRLQRQVLNQDEAIAAPREVRVDEDTAIVAEPSGYVPPAQLPAPPRGFVGRETVVEQLTRVAEREPVLVVDGMPGVGKTAIAVHTAAKLAERYPDGQLYVELHGYSGDRAAVAPEDALARMLRGLGAVEEEIPASVDERSAELRTRLAGRRVLIVLDNALDAAQVQPLLPGHGGCLVIVTSRRRLPELLDSEPVTLEVLGSDEAVRLLVSAVGDPRRVAEDSTDVAEIVEAAGRLPLAIRLIAARLRNRRNWTAEFMVKRLRERAVLDELSAQDLAVAGAFTVSYNELAARVQRMFRLLGLYPGQDFDVEYAAALAGVALDVADRSLEELVDAHLLQCDEPGRYRFHDLMRHYAATLAIEAEPAAEVAAARRRLYDVVVTSLRHAIAHYGTHSSHYPKLVEPVGAPASRWRTQVDATGWLSSELANLRVMTRDALEHRMDRYCAEMAAALCSYLSFFNLDRDTESVARWGLESALRIADEECEGYFRNKHAVALAALGDFEGAERNYQQALVIRRKLGDLRSIAGTLLNLGLLYSVLGDWDRTIAVKSEAIETAVASGNTDQEVLYRIILANSLWHLGRTAETRAQLELADRLAAGSADEDTRFELVHRWGDLLRQEGDSVAAQLLHEQAVAYYRSSGQVIRLADCQLQIARDLIQQGKWDEARSAGDTAINILSDNDRPVLRADIQVVLVETCLQREAYDDAIELLRTAENVAREHRSVELAADVDWGLARVMRALGDEDNAVRHAEQALAYFSRFDMPQAGPIRDFLSSTT